ncbi:MAG TPA: hypothetical protein VGI55_12455 [Solirubrobacteraceae bacterium]
MTATATTGPYRRRPGEGLAGATALVSGRLTKLQTLSALNFA